ncbi:MAG: hypothetical protein R3C09_13045 [Pirellulaceae bacterium]|jgi:hypothetical protein
MPQIGQAQLVDAIRSWFRDPLVRAIDQGLKLDGDLAWELEQLGYVEIESQEQGEAILRAVGRLPQLHGQVTQAYNSVDSSVANLFLQVYDTDSEAYVLLWRRGIPELIQHYETLQREYDQTLRDERVPEDGQLDGLLELLKVLATYQTREGTDLVIEAARSGLGGENYQWYSILSPYTAEHPQSERLFAELAQPLPQADNIAESLLDAANSAAVDDEGFAHPFASSAGLIRLKKWLSSSDEDDLLKAASAAVALAYLDLPGRDVLLDVAASHRDVRVRIEAAAAAVHAGLPVGLERLVEYCKDVHASVSAQEQLIQLEQSDLIPADALEPKFNAMAQFSHWLQSESELYRSPDELDVLDQRQLHWLDSDEPLQMSLVRYRSAGQTLLDDDDIGVGIVGSMTWSFFSEGIEQLPIEDIYAIHCAHEAHVQYFIEELDASELLEDGIRLNSYREQWTGEPLEQVEFVHLFRIDKLILKIPQSTTAIATAVLDGEPGWVVFDGSRSRWYPQSQFPEATTALFVLRLHIGRQLLGFPAVEVRQLRAVEHRELAPETVVSEYENWLGELPGASDEQRLDMLGSYGELSKLNRHFDKYVAAKASLTNQTQEAVYVDTYERLLEAAQRGDVTQRVETLDAFAVVGEKFPDYINCIAAEDPQRVAKLIDLFEPYWDHYLGRRYLAKAAVQAGLRDEAQRILEPHVDDDDNIFGNENTQILAEIWVDTGRVDEARELLSKANKRIQDELSGPDIAEYGEEFVEELRLGLKQNQELYQRLFP